MRELTFIEQARRQQIVAGAIEVLGHLGYAKASLAKITEHLGIAKSIVLYHFNTKSEVIEEVFLSVLLEAAKSMALAQSAESTATGRLAAYIRSNLTFIADHRLKAIAMLEIVNNHQTADGLRLHQVAALAPAPSQTPLFAALDPTAIFEQGMQAGEFRDLSPVFMKNALRAAIDGAVWEASRDPTYDLSGYGAELINIFTLATGRNQ